MLREYDRALRSLLLLVEVTLCATLFAGLVAYAAEATIPGRTPPGWHLWVVGLAASLALPLTIRALTPKSARFLSLGEHVRGLLAAAALAFGLVAGVAFFVASTIAPATLLACMGAQLGAVGAVRIGTFYGLRQLRRGGRNYRNLIVIGTGPRAHDFTETVERHPEWGVRIVGYVDDGDVAWSDEIPAEHVHKLADFPELLRDHVVDEVVVACPRSMLAALGPAIEACSAAGVPLTLMNDLFGDYLPPPTAKHFGSQGALSFAPVHHDPFQLGLKRGFDILGAALGLLVSAPVLLVAAAAIQLTSRGPVFFGQIRCGLHGRPFVMYKLRTMVCDAEAKQSDGLDLNERDGPVFKIGRELRITRLGRVLRALSIDELPRFWSVLVGDMSLVGPRPPIPCEVAQYKTWERRRLSMRPGLTCLWQVSGRKELGFDEWVRLDIEYIDSWSVAADLKLLLLTIPAVLSGTRR